MHTFHFSFNSPHFFTNNLIDLFPEEKSSDAGLDNSFADPPNDLSNHADRAIDSVKSLSSPLFPSSPYWSTKVRVVPSYLKDYYCYPTLAAPYEPQIYREACSNPIWQKAMAEKLQTLT